jgi:hypothetical protein
MSVDPLPVRGDPRRHAAQDMRRQVFHLLVQPQRMRDGIHPVFLGQFDRGLPHRLRQLPPPRLGAKKLI